MAYRVGPQKIVPSPGTYSAHVECGGKFSQVWPKLHLLSMWRWKRAPIARLVSLSVIWGGPPVFQVASSQTWGRARPRGETPAPGSAAPPLRSLSHGGFRSRLRSSSCGVEGGACTVGSKSHEELLGPSGALCCSAGAFGDTSGKPTFSWPSWGVAPRLSKTWSEKASGGAVAHQRASSAPVVARECSLSPPLWPSPRSQPRCPRVVREDERVRISAPCHVWRRFPRSRLHSLRFHQ